MKYFHKLLNGEIALPTNFVTALTPKPTAVNPPTKPKAPPITLCIGPGRLLKVFAKKLTVSAAV